MKRYTFCTAVLLTLALAGTVSAGKDKEEPQLRLDVDLVDGSRVIGAPGIDSVPLQTPYATMDVPLNQIRTITMGDDHETASCDLRNGDKLKGVVNLKPIKLETVFGTVAIGIPHISVLRVVLSGGALPDSLRTGLVLFCSFDKDENGRVTDAIDKKNNGESKGAQWTPQGKNGGAYRFTSGDYIDFPSSTFDFGRHITVSMWIKTDISVVNGQTIFWKSNDDIGEGKNLILGTYSDGRLWAGTYGHDGGITRPAAFWSQWHHIVAIYDTEQINYDPTTGIGTQIYLDGVQYPWGWFWATGGPNTASNLNGGHMYLGSVHPTANAVFNGSIDEVMIFNRALTGKEVMQIYDTQK